MDWSDRGLSRAAAVAAAAQAGLLLRSQLILQMKANLEVQLASAHCQVPLEVLLLLAAMHVSTPVPVQLPLGSDMLPGK